MNSYYQYSAHFMWFSFSKVQSRADSHHKAPNRFKTTVLKVMTEYSGTAARCINYPLTHTISFTKKERASHPLSEDYLPRFNFAINKGHLTPSAKVACPRFFISLFGCTILVYNPFGHLSSRQTGIINLVGKGILGV